MGMVTHVIFKSWLVLALPTQILTRILYLRPRPHVSGYFRIRNFFVPDTATVHRYPANSTANPEKNKYALQSGKKYIRNESDNVWTVESGYFFIR